MSQILTEMTWLNPDTKLRLRIGGDVVTDVVTTRDREAEARKETGRRLRQ